MSMTLMLLAILCACRQQGIEIQRTEILMGTEAQVIVRGENRESAEKSLENAFTQLKRIEKMMNRRDPNSELSKINAHVGKGEIRVSDDLLKVLIETDKVHKLSKGAFDPTVGDAMKLWDERRQLPPSELELALIRKKVGWQFVRINRDDKTIFLDENINLDLDGIAKGYSADVAVESAVQNGAQCALVNVGGDIAVKCSTSCPSWNIGINDPLRASEQAMFSVQIRSGGIATSGPARRYWLVNGRKFPRILNPQTLFPPHHAPLSATAFAPTAAEADAWSTSAVILGDGITTLNEENIPALLVLTEDKRFVFNEQWRKAFGVPRMVLP